MFFSKKFKSFDNINHCFFSKNGGVSKGIYNSLNCGLGSKDKKENILENINIVTKKIGVQNKNFFSMNQTHSSKVFIVNDSDKHVQRIDADALITDQKNIAISVLTADCIPILIYEEVNKIIACIHAGWKGAVNGIIENTLNEILKLNILQAALLSMKRAIDKLPVKPELILIDGTFAPNGVKNYKTIINGDEKIKCISAASIVAKTYRDLLMIKLYEKFNHYAWERNFGYGTKAHTEGLKKFGITSHHRKGFKPIHKMLSK